ncbi:hypothetical protein LINPERPRIM_LOCUS6220 [Linum perenne]
MRLIFTSRYGKDFAASAIELRNNCGVNRRVRIHMVLCWLLCSSLVSAFDNFQKLCR